jgi:hypothetical protein
MIADGDNELSEGKDLCAIVLYIVTRVVKERMRILSEQICSGGKSESRP